VGPRPCCTGSMRSHADPLPHTHTPAPRPPAAFTHYVFASIQIATMHMLGRLLRSGDDASAQQLLSSALGLALACGALVLCTLTLFSSNLVMATGVRDPEVVGAWVCVCVCVCAVFSRLLKRWPGYVR
jgi:hypothetical protein